MLRLLVVVVASLFLLIGCGEDPDLRAEKVRTVETPEVAGSTTGPAVHDKLVAAYVEAVGWRQLERFVYASAIRYAAAAHAAAVASERKASAAVHKSSPSPVSQPEGGEAPPQGSIWTALAQCESGGDWSISTGNGFYGGLQFTLSSWHAVGGSGYPHQASASEQISRGQALQRIQGWGAWPACARRLGLR
jgi:hypothetical protein